MRQFIFISGYITRAFMTRSKPCGSTRREIDCPIPLIIAAMLCAAIACCHPWFTFPQTAPDLADGYGYAFFGRASK
jgi:hypothetical protein